jgi:hypothetical protein
MSAAKQTYFSDEWLTIAHNLIAVFKALSRGTTSVINTTSTGYCTV